MVDAVDPGWRRLGAVLLKAGLVSEHDLTEALAEQDRSGRLLGEILISRGLVSAAAVANALAEQHGGFLKTEHGFGTGLGAITSHPSLAESASGPPEAPPVSLTPPPEQTFEDTPQAAVNRTVPANPLETEPALLPEEPQRPVEWSAMARPAEDLQAISPERQGEGTSETRGQPAPELGHLLFVPTDQGYLLLERDGTAPPVGDMIELPESPGARLVVAKLALSPLPRDRRVCAYLNNL